MADVPDGLTRRKLLVGASFFPFTLFRRHHADIAGTRFRILRHGEPRRKYIWIHGNETTARDVLREHIRAAEGEAFLIENATRNIPLRGGEIDPNRMFSDYGANRNLKTLNSGWTPAQIAEAVRTLAHDRPDFLHRLLPKDGQLLVALHNNSAGYSVTDEVPISNAVSLKNAEHPHEFLLCTDRRDFTRLSGSTFNVVLQDQLPPVDDGSLSVLCASRGLRYVNIEAAAGNASAQRAMLQWLEKALPD